VGTKQLAVLAGGVLLMKNKYHLDPVSSETLFSFDYTN